MILNDEDLISLKELIFSEEDEENPNKCMNCCIEQSKDCKVMGVCNRYGAFNFVDGAENIVRDLFETIGSLKGYSICECLNCVNISDDFRGCILGDSKEIECMMDKFKFLIGKEDNNEILG